jgi:hypothetical protein
VLRRVAAELLLVPLDLLEVLGTEHLVVSFLRSGLRSGEEIIGAGRRIHDRRRTPNRPAGRTGPGYVA